MSVHSNDGNTGLTKLMRIGKVSAENKDQVFNNLGHLITLQMLEECYHLLDGKKAVGSDGMTKQRYGEKLEENLKHLIQQIRRGTYRPKPARLVQIPKEDGSTRPLAIACFEDKLVQLAVNKILNAIYEPLFLPCSYGFRPNSNCHEALRALNQYAFRYKSGAMVDIDLRQYFNTIPHDTLLELLRKKIIDRRFLKLISTLIQAPIEEEGRQVRNERGCPQGSIISPVLANIYLHYVVDEWFATIRQTHLHGEAQEVRYADDIVFIFANPADAQRFYSALIQRLNRYGLALHEDKSQIIPSGYYPAKQAYQAGKKLPTFHFLGFVGYWGKTWRGFWRLKFTSRRDRFTAKLKGLREFLWKHLASPTRWVLQHVLRVIRGWLNYHGISDNQRRVKGFIEKCRRLLFKWLNRKGRKRRMSWQTFETILERIKFPKCWKVVSLFPTTLKVA